MSTASRTSMDSAKTSGVVGSIVLGLFAASAILMSCGQGVHEGGSGITGLTVALSNPASTVYTHGAVAVQVTVSGGTPDNVELLRDATLLVSLSPPYQYNWDTASTPEGSYQLVARASKGSQSFTSEPRTVVVDRTPPAVASRIPGPNATNVSVDDPIVVGFTKPLLPASVGPGSFSLRSGSTSVPTMPLLSGDGKTVMLLRHISLAVPATLTLTVTNSITDLAGNALVGADTWSWSVPEWVAVGGAVNARVGQSAFAQALAMDGSDKPVVTFWDYANIYVQRWTGSDWQPVGGSPHVVSGRATTSAALALDASDKPVVAFWEYGSVYVQRWTGSDWQSVGGVAGQGAFAWPPVLALDGSGKPVVAYHNALDYSISVRQWTGSDWQAVGAAINTGVRLPSGDQPGFALDGNGKPVVAFWGFDGTHNNVYVQRWTGSAWQSLGGPVNAVSGQSTGLPALALDGSGRAVVAYEEYDGAHSNIYVQRWTDGAWQLVGGPVNAVAGQNAIRPVLALDENGKPVVAFHEAGDVYVRRWTGRDWQAVGAAPNTLRAQEPAIALDGSGKPVVAFRESDGTRYNVYVRHSNQ